MCERGYSISMSFEFWVVNASFITYDVLLKVKDVLWKKVSGLVSPLSHPKYFMSQPLITSIRNFDRAEGHTLLQMWCGSKKVKQKQHHRIDWSEWCGETGVVDLSATKWLAVPFLCLWRPECILDESPDVLRPHSEVMYQTEQITPLSSLSPLSRGSSLWPYLFTHFFCAMFLKVTETVVDYLPQS